MGMTADKYPLRVLLLAFSGWVNRHQADVIAYLVEENRVLKEQMRGRRLRLTDDQRRRLAAKAKLLGRKALDRVATIVTPDTLMRWHRQLIALKWTYAAKRVGRPGLMKAIASLIVRMARENSSWGYCRIQGELKALGHEVASTTIANVLKANGIKPKFKRLLNDSGVDVVLTPKQAPNANAFAERFVLSIKSECLDRMIFFGEASFRRAIAEYLAHYHAERAHQGVGNERITGAAEAKVGEVRCTERLGGILKHYSRAA